MCRRIRERREISGSWTAPPHIHARHICADMWRATYPHNGDIYVFRAKRKDRLKLLLFDGTRMILATKWLENDGFAWPPIADGAIALTATQWAMLFEGLEGWSRIARKDIRRPTKVA